MKYEQASVFIRVKPSVKKLLQVLMKKEKLRILNDAVEKLLKK